MTQLIEQLRLQLQLLDDALAVSRAGERLSSREDRDHVMTAGSSQAGVLLLLYMALLSACKHCVLRSTTVCIALRRCNQV
ncbi:uncharacterized protein M421DRAFT_205976 [Didymella exigua CBS 183.55]|uniref:Uncharacterized protein n=1 Tax=Didymella exigua CBS 183.55 TaxID=1150837 RepID=A0A6A5RHM8_9PLEO|nr:uncharacterized protein M421DRAFT_205976 [Didymella exigua CBS 183.55]KAF1926750.1 hypothetical protein M421DRAFT_205976 [Didymella exigua CBS 183.55]